MQRWFGKFHSVDFGLEDEDGHGPKPSIENDLLIISAHLKAIGKVKN